MWRLFKLELSI